MNPVKLKLKRAAVQGIVDCIKELVQLSVHYQYNDNEKLVLAVLHELSITLDKKLCTVRKVYGFALAPRFALALRILHTDFLAPAPGAYISNVLLKISNTVHQQYQ